MRRALLAASLALLVCAGSAGAIAEEVTLSAMVSDLQRLQVKISGGDRAAYAAEPGQLRAIGAAILAARPEHWKDRNESIAAIVYLLSGGQPQNVAKVLQGGFVSKPEDNLMRGALAYTLGRERDAAALIDAIDPRSLDLRIGGQFAYILGVIQIPRNPKKALALLDLARLLAPGGLVEEASLRREILLAGQQKDTDQLAMLSRQYLVRFGSSIYAANFMQGFALTVVRLNLIDSLASFEKIQRAGRSMNSENRRAFMLAIAHGEVENGKFDVAEAASRDALRETASNSADEARGVLYQAIAHVFGQEYDNGIAQLATVDGAKLGASDKALFVAVRDLAKHLHESPHPSSSERERTTGVAPGGDGADQAARTIKLAEAAIERTGKLASSGAPP